MKSSEILKLALTRIIEKKDVYACYAIYNENPTIQEYIKAKNYLVRYKPDTEYSNLFWWPVGSPDRIFALEQAIMDTMHVDD